MISIQCFLLALLGALYLLRGMLEFPTTGWRREVVLTVVVGVGVLPLLAGIAASGITWRETLIGGLSLIGLAVNGFLLVRLWSGLSAPAFLTMIICAGYLAIVGISLTR
jgi:hypothetical protein